MSNFARGRSGTDRQPKGHGKPDNVDWLVLTDEQGNRRLAFQQVDNLNRTTWPLPELALGAELRLDRTDDPNEPLFVYADPAGHPFCIFVA